MWIDIDSEGVFVVPNEQAGRHQMRFECECVACVCVSVSVCACVRVWERDQGETIAQMSWSNT